jgi:hypothetical protein
MGMFHSLSGANENVDLVWKVVVGTGRDDVTIWGLVCQFVIGAYVCEIREGNNGGDTDDVEDDNADHHQDKTDGCKLHG